MSESKKETKYFIYYNNGYSESVDRLSLIFLHMVEIGLIKIIFDCNENKTYQSRGDGTGHWVTCTQVGGLV